MIEPSVRAANAEPLLAVLRSLGLNENELLAKAGLDAGAWNRPEQKLSLYALNGLLKEAERASGCDYVGLLVGMQTADLGLPSYLFFNAPDLASGVRDVIDLFALMNEGGSLALEENAGVVTIRYENVVPMVAGARHVTDCVLAQLQGALTRYCDGLFKAQQIRFPRRPPTIRTPYHQHFGRAKLVFNSDDAALEFPSSFLAYRSGAANAALYRYLKSIVPRMCAPEASLAVTINRLLRFMILSGELNVDQLAARVRLSVRTLRRKLRQEETSLQLLIGEARFEAATQLLLNTDLPISKIALSVGYPDASAFTRSFGGKMGMPPSEYRRRQLNRQGSDPADPTI